MKMQIKEFAVITGTSVRTLHYYDEIGLLTPALVDGQTGYRYYDENSLLRMQEILFYRELEFPLKSIKDILSSPNYDKQKALSQQKKLLILKKEQLEKLINAVDDAMKGEIVMDVFKNNEFEQYRDEVKEKWGKTDAYKEYEEKSKGKTSSDNDAIISGMNEVLSKFAQCMENGNPATSDEAKALVKELQQYITDNFYTCTNEILAGLGKMYVADERFKKNIDKNGDGTALFISQAIEGYFR